LRSRRLLERLVAEHGEDVFARPHRFDSCAWVGARLAEILPLPGALKQQLLEMDGLPRLEALQRLLVEQG
jgi:Lon protease-like protein